MKNVSVSIWFFLSIFLMVFVASCSELPTIIKIIMPIISFCAIVKGVSEINLIMLEKVLELNKLSQNFEEQLTKTLYDNFKEIELKINNLEKNIQN